MSYDFAMDKLLLTLVMYTVLLGCQNTEQTFRYQPIPHDSPSDVEFVRYSDIMWGDLNPARGDQSPRAADLWGDRTVDGATGFLVKFKDGFQSPPHIHNVTYRGVVIAGEVHNDDPNAGFMWMPQGSFWVQPAGGNHITATRGNENIAYIEIDAGPYLVRPSDQAYDIPLKPISVDASNVVWVDLPSGVEKAYLWGDPDGDQAYGVFLKFPQAFEGSILAQGPLFRGIVIQGELSLDGILTKKTWLEPGSYFGSEEEAVFKIRSGKTQPCIVYIRSTGPIDVMGHMKN